MNDKPDNAWVVVIGCAASVAIVALLVAIIVSDGRVLGDSIARQATLPDAAISRIRMDELQKQAAVACSERLPVDTGERNCAPELAR